MLFSGFRFLKLCIFSFFILFPILILAQERDALDMVLSENDKADVEDIIEMSKTMSEESQSEIKDLLSKWEDLERNFANLPPSMQDFVNKLNAEGLKTKLNTTLEGFEKYDAGLKSLIDKKEKVDQVIHFYDRYKPDSQNPFRSLEVLNNVFTDAESLLPKEVKYEYVRKPMVWLIRVGIGYFKAGIGNALSGLKNIQKQIKDRAGNCIGYVGGDATADSSDPKRKAFTDLNTGDIICYTGIRPIGGEIWSNTNGDGVLIWSNDKWTKLNCGLGTVAEIFNNWKLANGIVLTEERMIYWCNKELAFYNNLKSTGQMQFDILYPLINADTRNCRYILLFLRNKQNEFKNFMNSYNNDKELFVAKYIFNKNNTINKSSEFTRIVTETVLFEGKVKDENDNPLPNATVTLETNSGERNDYTKQDGKFERLIEIPLNNQTGSPVKISVSADGFKDFEMTTTIREQCMDLGHITLKKVGQLIIQPEYSNIKVGEEVDFTVLFSDGVNNTDVTSEALNNSIFKGISEGNFSVQALYGNYSATATIKVEKENKCPNANEIWDDAINDCRCIDGYEKNENNECVEISDTPDDVVCTDPNSEKIWDDMLQQYVCNCKENFIPDPVTGLCTEDINALISQSDCANAAGAVAKWDAVNKIVICTCTDNYYIWDDSQKKCVPDIQAILDNSDCGAYLNTVPVWDYSLNEPICDCAPGYVWNKENTACVEGKQQQIANADCSGYLNTRAVWDDNTQQVVCDCLPGYVWNKDDTQCIPEWEEAMQDADCSGYLNTEPVWDPVNKEVYCDCLPGYEWADDNLSCVKSTTENSQNEGCSPYPNTEPVWDPVSNQYFCDCIPGYVWNSKRTGCIPQKIKPDFNIGDAFVSLATGILNAANGNYGTINQGYPGTIGNPTEPPVMHQSNCNDKQQSGGDAPEVHTIDLGQTFGSFQFDYNTYDVKDQIIVTNGGRTIFNSGCVGEKKSIRLNLSGFSSTVTVRVNPNCGGTKSTGWDFTVHCPNN